MIAHAVGLLVKDRWELTQQTLQSIYYSDQPKKSFHLYIIDNGSDEETSAKLKEYAQSGLVPVKKLVRIPPTTIPIAWNLFLMLTADYPFRTKIDNDIILHGTIRPAMEKAPRNVSTPAQADPLAGAPRSRSIVGAGAILREGGESVGMGASRRGVRFASNDIKPHSAFLQHMEEFGSEYNVGQVALVTVPPKGNFRAMFRELTTKLHNERPFLASGCIQITRDAFKQLGYLDERLVQQSFRDYSQRGLRAKINIGYHPYYGSIHSGATTPTIPNEISREQLEAAESAEKTPVEQATTCWLKHETAIKNMCEKHKIVSIG